MKCPKCGHEQEDDTQECQRCGIIFARYRQKPGPTGQGPSPSGAMMRKDHKGAPGPKDDAFAFSDPFDSETFDPHKPTEFEDTASSLSLADDREYTPDGGYAPPTGWGYGTPAEAIGKGVPERRFPFFRLIQLVSLAVLVAVVVMILKKPAGHEYQPAGRTRALAKSAENKIMALGMSERTGNAVLTEQELNSFMGRALGFLERDVSAAADRNMTVTDMHFRIFDNRMLIIAFYSIFGRDILLSIKGVPYINSDGFFDFKAEKVLLGSLPLPAATVLEALKKAQLEQEDQKQSLKAPYYLKDIRIDKGYLILETR